MASRGSIPKMMELAGIDMLPPEAGVPIIRRELTAGATRGEIVIAQRLGALLNEWDASGGLDTAAVAPARGPMFGEITNASLYNGFSIETTLDPTLQPFLHDHQIEGTPVLPGVMGIEAFAEAALCTFPGWRAESIEDVNFLAPFKFYRSEPRTVTTEAVIYPCASGLVADCRLIGRRSLPNQKELQVTTHFTARVRLTKTAPKKTAVSALKPPTGAVVEAADIYRLYFHGPAYQVLEQAWWGGERVIGLMAKGLRNNHHPVELPTLIAPRLIELCFQTAGVWEMGLQSRMGLPWHINSVSLLLEPPDPAQVRLYAVVTPNLSTESFDAEVVDMSGNRYLILRGYKTVAVAELLNADQLKKLQDAMTAEAVMVA